MNVNRTQRLLGVAALSVVLSALAFGGTAGAQSVGEHIRSYGVTLTVQPDGELLVVERIDYDFAGTSHHGIYRDIPVRAPYDTKFDRVYPIKVLSVTATGGASAKVATKSMNDLLRIQIGDANKTVTGEHVYTLTYRVTGSLNGFEDHDELYWNAIGQYWTVPIDRASVKVTVPGKVTRAACFTGPLHSGLPCYGTKVSGRTATFGSTGLLPYEGITVAVGFPTGLVPKPHPVLKERWAFQRAFSLTPVTGSVTGLLLLVILFGLGRLLWRTGRDRRAAGSEIDAAFGSSAGGEVTVPLFEKGTTPVEFAPPEDIRPGQVGTLLDETANPLDVTATIIDLAVRGYLRIEEIPKHGLFGKPDWRLVRLKPSDDLLEYEQLLLDGLFEDATEKDPQGNLSVLMSELRKHFAARLVKVENALYDDATKRKWFAGRPDKVRATWHARGWAVLIVAGIAMFVVAGRTHYGLITVPFVLAGLVIITTAHRMPRRSAKGTGMVRRVRGFRVYIDTAEKQEARFQERENIFSKYLPYAVVFGLTEKWAKAFAHLGDDMTQMVPWYVGTQAFSPVGFASSVDHFSTMAAGSIATSAASGHSGFSGGFSGGGGGGGGGGSW
jgi:uncharacterized membrane protein YgcG